MIRSKRFTLSDSVIRLGYSIRSMNMYSSPHGSDSQQAADDEWAWINQTLAEYFKSGSGVGWIFVARHYPGIHIYNALTMYTNNIINVCCCVFSLWIIIFQAQITTAFRPMSSYE